MTQKFAQLFEQEVEDAQISANSQELKCYQDEWSRASEEQDDKLEALGWRM